MKEQNDKDFDQLFKTRMSTAIPEFEEESWSKMEKKLHQRDRLVFYRNASIVALLLSFALSFYYTHKTTRQKDEVVVVKKPAAKEQSKPIVDTKRQLMATLPKMDEPTSRASMASLLRHDSTVSQASQINQHINKLQQAKGLRLNANAISNLVLDIRGERSQIVKVVAKPADEIYIAPKTNIKVRRKVPVSLALVLAPDFNSTTQVIGGKANLAFGVGIGIGLTKKLSVQTGINYGHKNYDANADNYTFNNPNTKYTITEVNATCEVIEIPLRAALTISENQKRSIEVNAGLSSYMMLKENYLYKYTAVSGRADRLVEATNENQHLLSIVDLSATYNIKLKNKKLAIGIEPYVKIPLTGIGVGSVPLKSSGIALKLRYDFNKN